MRIRECIQNEVVRGVRRKERKRSEKFFGDVESRES